MISDILDPAAYPEFRSNVLLSEFVDVFVSVNVARVLFLSPVGLKNKNAPNLKPLVFQVQDEQISNYVRGAT